LIGGAAISAFDPKRTSAACCDCIESGERALGAVVSEGCPMATQRAHKEPFAWWLTKLRIGQDLRERYPVLRELPPHLVTLVGKLDAVECNLPESTHDIQ